MHAGLRADGAPPNGAEDGTCLVRSGSLAVPGASVMDTQELGRRRVSPRLTLGQGLLQTVAPEPTSSWDLGLEMNREVSATVQTRAEQSAFTGRLHWVKAGSPGGKSGVEPLQGRGEEKAFTFLPACCVALQCHPHPHPCSHLPQDTRHT